MVRTFSCAWGYMVKRGKRTRWMPRRSEAMKDVVACEKPRGAGERAMIRGSPNGATHLVKAGYLDLR